MQEHQVYHHNNSLEMPMAMTYDVNSLIMLNSSVYFCVKEVTMYKVWHTYYPCSQ